MALRYQFLALINLLAGGFIAVATYGFDATTAVWCGFGVSIGVLLLGLAMAFRAYEKDEPVSLLVLGVVTAAVATWTIVASQVFPDETARWMVFASGLTHIGLSVIAFLLTEGVIDRPTPAPAGRAPAAPRGARRR
jgi:putative Mn2+ efflux pump MntP